MANRGIPKRPKGAVSKTARRCKSRRGSNPLSSAIIDCQDTYGKVRVFSYLLSILAIFECFYK